MFYVSLGVIGLGFLMCSISVLKSDNFKQKFAEKKAQKLEDKKLKGRNKDAMMLKDGTVKFINDTKTDFAGNWGGSMETLSEYGKRNQYGAALDGISFIIFEEKTGYFDYIKERISLGDMDKETATLFRMFFNSDNFSKAELEEISYLILLKIHTFFPSYTNCLLIFEDKTIPYELRKNTIASMWEILHEVTLDTIVPLLEAKKENKEIEQTAYQRQIESLKDSIELDKEIYSRYKGN